MKEEMVTFIIAGLLIACLFMDIQVILNHRRIKKLEERLKWLKV